jgi:hypothetical protein
LAFIVVRSSWDPVNIAEPRALTAFARWLTRQEYRSANAGGQPLPPNTLLLIGPKGELAVRPMADQLYGQRSVPGEGRVALPRAPGLPRGFPMAYHAGP